MSQNQAKAEQAETVNVEKLSADMQELLLKLPADELRKMSKKVQSLKKIAEPKAPELPSVAEYFPEPTNRKMSVVVLKKNNQVAKRFENDTIWSEKKGEYTEAIGLMAGTAKNKLRRWLHETPSELEKLKAGEYRVQIRYDRKS